MNEAGGAMTKPAIQIEQPLFDYRELESDDRAFVKERALRIRDVAKRTAEGIIQIGQWLSEAKARIPHGGWLPWLESEFGWSISTATNFMRVFENVKFANVTNLEIDVSALYFIAAPKTPEPVRQEIIKRAEAGEPMTKAKAVEVFEAYKAQAEQEELLNAQTNAQQEAEHKATKVKRAVTLAEWKSLSRSEREPLLRSRNDKAKPNKQDGTSIEWARWSWNPVTGCLHNCPYCYARDIAERFYTQKFEPSLVPTMLSAPLNQMPPKEAALDLGWKNIFTCSMADLFGNWVPAEWIEAVFAVMREAPQWNFLLLTKFPQRLKEFKFPENAWPGTSIDLQARVPNAEKAMREVDAAVKWVSIEPLIEPITLDFSIFQWAVIGGASASSQTPEWKPPRKWVRDLTTQAENAGCAVYHKDNLNLARLRNYPGFAESEPKAAPSPFHYLKASAKER
jgi:protein gp37